MTDPVTPAAVARLLTPAQRAALLRLPEDGERLRVSDGFMGNAMYMLERVFVGEDVMVRLAFRSGPYGGIDWALTPLGRRVRREVANAANE